jgi:hypothetical protein
MVSRLRYYAFKDFDLRNRRSYLHVLPLAGVLVFIAVYPKGTLLLVSTAYLLSAPTFYIWSLMRRVRDRSGAWTRDAGDDPEVADESPRP